MTSDIQKIISEMTLDEKVSLLSGEDFWHTKAVDRLGIPSVMICDGPNGLRKQDGAADHLGINQSIKAVSFPTSSAIAASFDREIARKVGQTIGSEAKAEKISMVLGPGVNIKRSPLCGRNFEYYSEDPCLSSEMAASYIEGIQSNGVSACMKHFAANNQETHRMNGNSVIDERTLHEIYLASFEGAVRKSKPASVMCAYNQLNGCYGAENEKLNVEILRKKWGFDGFMVTDWGAIKDHVIGLKAGIELEMPGSPSGAANNQKVKEAVENGSLPESALNKAVEKLLTWILKTSNALEENVEFHPEEDYKKAVEIEKNCAVLLKNQAVLPLKKGTKTAFIGGFVKKPRYQGSGSSHINSSYVPPIAELTKDYDEISFAEGFSLTDYSVNEALEEEAVKLAEKSENIVIFAGLPERFETEGVDRKHLRLPENQNHLIARIAMVNPRTVVVLHNGAPIEMPWIDEVSAVLEMYLGGDGVSEATLSILYGDTNPSGKLAETFPLKLEDNPSYLNFPGENGVSHYNEGIFVGYRYYDRKKMNVLFPFGHGLSYTTFSYENMVLSKEGFSEGETLQVSFTLKNIGDRAGAEAVQLYIGAADSKIIRPVKELKDFRKVFLQPGESRKITFEVDRSFLSYYEVKLDDWFAPTGNYKIMIGSSSKDIRLQKEIAFTAVTRIPIVFTRDSSLGDLAGNPKAEMLFSVVKYDGATEADVQSLGEAGGDLAAAMMEEMSLGSLVGFGMMSEEQLDGLIQMLNS